jgi:hypothetical protein
MECPHCGNDLLPTYVRQLEQDNARLGTIIDGHQELHEENAALHQINEGLVRNKERSEHALSVAREALVDCADNLRLTQRELRHLSQLEVERGLPVSTKQAKHNGEAIMHAEDALARLDALKEQP